MFGERIIVIFFSTLFICTLAATKNVKDVSPFMQSLKDLGKSLSSEQRFELTTILTNPETTKQQVFDKLKDYFEKIGGDTEVKYKAVVQQFKAMIAELRQSIDEKMPSMDNETKEMITKVRDIYRNRNISFAEERKQLKALFDTASPELKAKIKALKLFDGAGAFKLRRGKPIHNS